MAERRDGPGDCPVGEVARDDVGNDGPAVLLRRHVISKRGGITVQAPAGSVRLGVAALHQYCWMCSLMDVGVDFHEQVSDRGINWWRGQINAEEDRGDCPGGSQIPPIPPAIAERTEILFDDLARARLTLSAQPAPASGTREFGVASARRCPSMIM